MALPWHWLLNLPVLGSPSIQSRPARLIQTWLLPFVKIIIKKLTSQISVGRLGKPEEVARFVTFLVADESGFITGANIAVNGGMYMCIGERDRFKKSKIYLGRAIYNNAFRHIKKLIHLAANYKLFIYPYK